MKTRTNALSRVFAWAVAFALVFSLAAVPASAESGALSAELLISSEEMNVSGKVALDVEQAMLMISAVMTSGEEAFTNAIYLSPLAFIVESDLVGGSYGLDLPALADNLPNSIFAPDSGSAFALDEETYSQIMEMFGGELTLEIPEEIPDEIQDITDNPALTNAAAVLNEALMEPMTKAAENLVMESANVTEIINGSSVDATQMKVTADGDAILGFVEALITTLQADPAAQDAMVTMLDAMNASGVYMEYSGSEMVRKLVEEGDQIMEELRAQIAENGLAVTVGASLSSATEAPVKLSMDIEMNGSTMSFNILIAETLDFFRAEMLADGQMGPAIQFEMLQDSESATTFKLSVSEGDNVESASIALTLDMAEQTFQLAVFSDGTTSTISGFFVTEENLFSLTVDQVNGQEFGGVATLNLRSDDSFTAPDFSEITAMSEEEFSALVQSIAEVVSLFTGTAE